MEAATSQASRDGQDRPSGPVAAVLLATGIGSVVLGLLVTAAEASTSLKESLQWDDEVGPLSGKTIWAAIAFFVSWGLLWLVLRHREVNLRTATLIAGVLFALGLLGTFPTFFQAFTTE